MQRKHHIQIRWKGYRDLFQHFVHLFFFLLIFIKTITASSYNASRDGGFYGRKLFQICCMVSFYFSVNQTRRVLLVELFSGIQSVYKNSTIGSLNHLIST